MSAKGVVIYRPSAASTWISIVGYALTWRPVWRWSVDLANSQSTKLTSVLTFTAACMLTSMCPIPVTSRFNNAVSAPRTANALALVLGVFPTRSHRRQTVIVVSAVPHHPPTGEDRQVRGGFMELGASPPEWRHRYPDQLGPDRGGKRVTTYGCFHIEYDITHARGLLRGLGVEALMQGPGLDRPNVRRLRPGQHLAQWRQATGPVHGIQQLIGFDLEIMEPNFKRFVDQIGQGPCLSELASQPCPGPASPAT